MAGKKSVRIASGDIKQCYPLNLLREVLNGTGHSEWDYNIPEFLKEVENLGPKSSNILELRFRHNKTFEDIGAIHGVTRERVRQLQNLGLSKLRSRLVAGKCLMIRRSAYEHLEMENRMLKEKLQTLMPDVIEKYSVDAKYVDRLTERVDSLGLSNRTYRALYLAGIETVADIINFDADVDRHWEDIRCLGVKSRKELYDAVYNLVGYSIGI